MGGRLFQHHNPAYDIMVYFCKYRRKLEETAKCARDHELLLAPACGIYNYLNKNFNKKKTYKNVFTVPKKLEITDM